MRISRGSELDGNMEETSITVEYLTWPIIRYKREVLFGWVDLLVSFGGIAGLFLGFSLLSGVEIVYYFTMRTCCMVYKNRVRCAFGLILTLFSSCDHHSHTGSSVRHSGGATKSKRSENAESATWRSDNAG